MTDVHKPECDCGHTDAQHPRGVCAVSTCKCETFEESESSTWARIKAEGREKRWKNFKQSLGILDSRKIPYRIMDEHTGHVRVDDRFEFYPTTGVFINKQTREKGRGVFELIKALNNISV